MDLEVSPDTHGVDDPSIAVLGHVEATLAVALLVVIAVREERPELQRDRRAGHQPVGQDGSVHAQLHPDALFDDAAVDEPAERRQHPVDLHRLQPPKSVGVDGAVPIFRSRERLRWPIGAPQPLLNRCQ